MNRVCLIALLMAAGVLGLAAQEVSKFDVASVKPSAPGGKFDCKTLPGGRFVCHNMPAFNLLLMAFADQYQAGRVPKVRGNPGWMDEAYDIDAVAQGAGEMSDVDVARPLRALLQERFGLVARLEMVQEDGFSMEQARSGAKVTASAPDAVASTRRLPDGVVFTAATMSTLAVLVGNRDDVKATVVDHTGLEGKYDFKYLFNYALAETPVDGVAQAGGGNSAFEALAEIGLRLVRAKVMVSAIIVEQIHRPTEN